MKVYLVRHGESVSADIDPNQPLSPNGIKKMELFGEFLKKCDIKLDDIYHSGKERARQTAEILALYLAPNLSIETKAGLKPNDPPEGIISDLSHDDRNVMIVGHLPSLESLLNHLLGSEMRGIFRFHAGAIVCIEKSENGWLLSWTLSPEILA